MAHEYPSSFRCFLTICLFRSISLAFDPAWRVDYHLFRSNRIHACWCFWMKWSFWVLTLLTGKMTCQTNLRGQNDYRWCSSPCESRKIYAWSFARDQSTDYARSPLRQRVLPSLALYGPFHLWSWHRDCYWFCRICLGIGTRIRRLSISVACQYDTDYRTPSLTCYLMLRILLRSQRRFAIVMRAKDFVLKFDWLIRIQYYLYLDQQESVQVLMYYSHIVS